ncbi:MAG: homocysteine S-methyltransferase family protein [Firmicutes bacterium]|nr:homocysteine S-methyltransferase family protein [Bacillota bacterium]
MKFREFLKDNIVYLDGGMGTLLQAAGLKPGEHPERWNVSHPEEIVKIQAEYYSAGSNVVNTNTFGANLLKFEREELDEIIGAAIANARKAREISDGDHPKFVALDIGPSGRLLKPYGDFDFEEAVSVFAETVKIGVKYGVDLVTVETMNDSYETKAALLAVKENCDLPVIVTNAYGEDGKLMTGASPAAMVAMLEGMRADAIGVNCSLGPKALEGVVREYLRYASVPVVMKPNAGLPKVEGGKTVYDVFADEFSDDLTKMIGEGLRVAGGCCGTTPEYIKMLTGKSAGMKPAEIVKKTNTLVSSYTHAVDFADEPILIGERINPTGKKRFKQALKENDIGYILSEGISQQEKGVHILDVNVGLPEIDEKKMLKSSVCELQAIINLPLQIDTADAAAMEDALRAYNGKAMVNSVNGKEESMKAIFPLVAKYGGVVVALTLDENGIPETAEGRIAIAEKIIETAKAYGIERKDIVFDTLAMAISADASAAEATIGALSYIKNNLGCHTSLGVSNISFGLPNRDDINSTFFAMALEKGLSAAIMNPYSDPMMRTYYAYRALRGKDENCAEYIGFAQNHKIENVVIPAAARTSENHGSGCSCGVCGGGNAAPDTGTCDTSSELQRAITKGLKAQAADLTDRLLEREKPLDIVQNEIIPALDIVGKGFEQKTVYLPQLLMSAEAAKSAFERIKHAMLSEKEGSAASGCAVVIATVKGDIHDIGKNIVKLLLENYGFAVSDLGKDVEPEMIVDEVIKLHAPIAGLSALMTTTVPAMEETIKQLRERAPWCNVIVGGAVLTEEYANLIGADYYAKDAMTGIRIAEEIESTL